MSVVEEDFEEITINPKIIDEAYWEGFNNDENATTLYLKSGDVVKIVGKGYMCFKKGVFALNIHKSDRVFINYAGKSLRALKMLIKKNEE